MNLGTINRLIVTESYFWRLIVAESRTINMDSLAVPPPGHPEGVEELVVLVRRTLLLLISLFQQEEDVPAPLLLGVVGLVGAAPELLVARVDADLRHAVPA